MAGRRREGRQAAICPILARRRPPGAALPMDGWQAAAPALHLHAAEARLLARLLMCDRWRAVAESGPQITAPPSCS